MECNKDEAIRARELSEKKMANNDFEGARNVALKAKKLYPELENISQLLSICDVHCSAQKRVGSEKDWYAILQIERLSDESTIKKQYRRLALALHPDKNRLPGAEAAFKLISEANAILSDATKKSSYDTKIRISVPAKPPPHYMNRNSNMDRQSGARNNIPNGFRNLNQHQTGAGMSFGQEVFWTCCPFCQMRYQYQREHVNKSVRCQKCHKGFMACEISVQGVPLRSTMHQPDAQMPAKPGSQPAAFHEKVVLNQGYSKVGVQNANGSSSSHPGSQGNTSKKAVQPEPGIKMGSNPKGVHLASADNGNGDLKAKGEYTNYKHSGHESGGMNDRSKKRGRKMVVESSESLNSLDDSDAEDEMNAVNSGNFATNVDSGPRRRSSRIKQTVSYNESDDEDLRSSIKRQKASKILEDNCKEQKDGEDSKLGNQKNFPANANFSKSTSRENLTAFEESLRDKNAEHKVGGETSGMPENSAETAQFESDSDLESDPQNDSDVGKIICPDPEFYDFDKERDPSLFKVDQIWACYDEHDDMPRFYAKLTKAISSPFEVSYKWLEPVPIIEGYEDWVDEQPVGCGTYKLDRKIQKTSVQDMFSHQMMLWPGKKKGPVIIYPRKGEIWALFRNWDISWCSNPENHKEFEYEVVEVLSDFIPRAGINVCYLDKVAGFVSLFQRSSQGESDSFRIRPNELYKFSHRVPSFKMTGSERDGVPIGSCELDPASLPLDPDRLHFPAKENKESIKRDTGIHCSPPNSATGKGKSVKSGSTSNQHSFVDLDE